MSDIRSGALGSITRSHRRTERHRRWSVGAHLVVVVAVAAAMIVVALGYGFSWGANQAESRALEQMASQSALAAAAITDAVDAGREQVAGVAGQPGLAAVLDAPEGCSLVVSGSGAFPEARMDILDADGTVVCSSLPALADPAAPLHHADPWVRNVSDSAGASIVWAATDAHTQGPAVVIAEPFGAGTGAPLGTVALFLDVPAVAAGLVAAQAMPSSTSFVVVDRATGIVISASGSGAVDRVGRQVASARAAGEWVGVDGVRRVYASSDVPASDWRVYGGVEQAAVIADARGTVSRQGMIGAVALFALALAAWVLNRKVARPMRALTHAAIRAREGADDARVREEGTAELATLAREFNTMLDVRAGHEARLGHHATHDRLTGLPTSEVLRDRLDVALQAASAERSVAVLCVGLSRLQMVHDTLGADGVDRALFGVAERLSAAVRDRGMVARAGAQDFLIVCEDLAADDAVLLAQRVHQEFAGPTPGLAGVVLDAAVGVAVNVGAGNADRLLREADTAMAEARTRETSWAVFDESMRARATRHLQTVHDLRAAVEQDQFEVHYQPLVNTMSGKIVGAEALVRWQHPTRGLVAPVEFIPLAEETGQVAAIGQIVLRRACAQAVVWAANGHPLRVSVNVAPDQLQDARFTDMVGRALADTGLAPDRLCLEITETALVRRASRAASTLTALRTLGVQIAIDDFGTGYSSLAYLRDLPVDELKIDRAFITRIERDHRDTHVVAAVVGMAKALDLIVVAEGVENSDQLSVLTGLGCTYAQGYLFARPQGPEGFMDLLRKREAAQRLVPTVALGW